MNNLMSVKRINLIVVFLVLLSSCVQTKTEINTLDITQFDLDTAKNGVLIDVRTLEEYAEGHLPNAINIDVQDDSFAVKMEKLRKNRKVYLYCKTGKRSARAAAIADTLGFKNIYNLDGGFIGWKEAGKVVETSSN